ncbi:hypothetical protein [Phreatobacter sp.]|uniref:hypothetical protein n=1 Tax=Phreatobacter sp. TaxID=1966341 RepID=UPI003F701773
MGESGNRDDIEAEAGGSGSHGIAGYEYQIEVSVWLALDLMLAAKLTQEVVLEPASEEDVEAELEADEPGRITTAVPMSGYTLVVQAKLRSGDAWSVKGVKALLEHGGTRRQSASARLADPDVRYLLVTSAGLNGGTRDLKVRRAGVWPNPAKMPALIAKALPAGARGRVAVIGNQDEERLATDIKRLLTESFRVPHARWEACLKVLREEARVRIHRGGSGRWRRDELERVIRDHEGYIASSPELEHYVHPTNWGDLRSMMRERRAALIIGQSGTGKTLATRKLYEELRAEIPGLAHVPIKLGPQQLRDDRTAPPVLYDIEDPWGRFDFDPASRPWNDQLAQLFAHASHDRLIIATSRLDVAQTSGALESVKPWLVALEAEHYGRKERIRLYRSRIDGLPRELRSVAAQAEPKVLAELSTPLEIQKYFDALPAIDREKLLNPPGFVAEAIDRAHQNSIERTVIEQIEQRRDVRAAAIVWGLLKATDKLSLRVLRPIEESLADQDAAMTEGVTPLVDFFVAARNLRQTEETVTYYHPRVEAGIEQTLARHELVARRTLRLLIDLLVAPDGPGEAWGVAAAARLLAAADRRPALKPSPTTTAAAKIDAWLAARLAEGGREFEANLQLARAAGSSDSNASELARYLLNRPNPSFAGMMNWGPPEKDDAWYARLRADPSTKPLVETFIREVLPTERDDYPSSFVADVERLAPDLSSAFLDAATRAVHFGFIYSDDTIAAGALRDLDGFEAIVDAAVQVLTPSEEERKRNAETHLAIINGEYSEDYAEHIGQSDDGHTAREFLGAYVERVRATKGWQHIAQHRHRDRLLYYWLRSLAKADERSAPNPDEIAGAFAAGQGSADEDDLWFVLRRAWDPRYLPALSARLVEGHPDRAVRTAALTCAIERAPEELAAVGRELGTRGRWHRLVETALDLSQLRSRASRDEADHDASIAAAIAALPAPLPALAEASLRLSKNQAVAIPKEAHAVLEGLEAESEDVRWFRVAVDAHAPLPVDNDIRWLLSNSEDDDAAVDALEAAIRREMQEEVAAALDHKFAQVRARALSAIGGALAAPLPARFLAKAADRGSPVRKALVALLDAKPHAAHLPILLRLAKDSWSRSSGFYGEEDDFPIARAAVDAIEKSPPLAAEEAEQLYAIGIETSDPGLRFSIFRLLARTSGQSVQERLIELSVTPGRMPVRRAAAVALLQAGEVVAPEVIQRITPDLFATRVEPVAANLTLLFAWRADVDAVVRAAEALATNAKRRVLLLLMAWVVKDRDAGAARTIAAMLPADHPGVSWALGGELPQADDAMLANLGEPAICAQVLIWMKPKA